MTTPLDVERARQKRLASERQARRDAEEIEHSISLHYERGGCDHHCSDCCDALYLQENP